MGKEAAILGFFVILGVALTYPLLVEFTSAIIGRGSDHEEAIFAWNLWWTRHALLELGQNPLWTDYVFQPFTLDLRLHTFALLYGLISIPMQPFLGVGGSLNAMILLTIALNGYTVFLLGRHLLQDDRAALVAGAIVAVNPTLTFHLRAGKPSFAAIWPLALALLFLSRLATSRRRRDALGLGLALLSALLIDFQILLYASLWLALYGAYLVLRRPPLLSDRRFVAGLILALILVGAPFLLLFYPALVAAAAHGYPIPTARDTLVYSLQVKHFLWPSFLRLTFGLSLPLLVIATLVTLARTRKPLFWLTGAVCFLVLSLGIALQPTGVPLPFALLRKVPGLAQFRTPYRFTIPATLGLALAAAGAWSYWRSRFSAASWNRRWLVLTAVFLGLLVLDSRAVAPFVPQSYPVAPIYRQISRQPGDFTVLEVPLGVRSGTDVLGYGDFLQYYQTVHQKRTVNGMVARVPRVYFETYRRWPSFLILAGQPVPDGVDVNADLSRRLQSLRVGYVIVHPEMLEEPALARIEALLARQPGLTPVGESSELRVYRVTNNDNLQ